MRPAFFLVPFGLLFGGFAVFWVGSAAFLGAEGVGGFFACFGVPFVLVGLALVLSPVWLRKKAANTVYALTDRRAVLWEPGWFGAVTVRSYGQFFNRPFFDPRFERPFFEPRFSPRV